LLDLDELPLPAEVSRFVDVVGVEVEVCRVVEVPDSRVVDVVGVEVEVEVEVCRVVEVPDSRVVDVVGVEVEVCRVVEVPDSRVVDVVGVEVEVCRVVEEPDVAALDEPDSLTEDVATRAELSSLIFISFCELRLVDARRAEVDSR
jgi:hypothetical protein